LAETADRAVIVVKAGIAAETGAEIADADAADVSDAGGAVEEGVTAVIRAVGETYHHRSTHPRRATAIPEATTIGDRRAIAVQDRGRQLPSNHGRMRLSYQGNSWRSTELDHNRLPRNR
jgi:hypothetical protein